MVKHGNMAHMVHEARRQCVCVIVLLLWSLGWRACNEMVVSWQRCRTALNGINYSIKITLSV